jgi:hypothetical protein
MIAWLDTGLLFLILAGVGWLIYHHDTDPHRHVIGLRDTLDKIHATAGAVRKTLGPPPILRACGHVHHASIQSDDGQERCPDCHEGAPT